MNGKRKEGKICQEGERDNMRGRNDDDDDDGKEVCVGKGGGTELKLLQLITKF